MVHILQLCVNAIILARIDTYRQFPCCVTIVGAVGKDHSLVRVTSPRTEKARAGCVFSVGNSKGFSIDVTATATSVCCRFGRLDEWAGDGTQKYQSQQISDLMAPIMEQNQLLADLVSLEMSAQGISRRQLSALKSQNGNLYRGIPT